MNLDFYKGKRVLVTGHTGFKGSWLCQILINAGAIITGYSLEPPTNPNLFSLINVSENVDSIIGDIRDFDKLSETFKKAQPEIVFHLAAQPIVRDSYNCPKYTYETNVMGTVNVLECVRVSKSVRSVVNVTTDKVYLNNDLSHPFKENEPLDGFDPYSNSKSCSELVTHSYINSFFAKSDIAISTVRAGNVIGGGDFANYRIIPDCVRAVKDGKKIGVRSPDSIRPYQHVLEPLSVYLMIAAMQYDDKKYSGYYNVGPDDCDCVTTEELVDKFCKCWGSCAEWENQCENNAPHEAKFLRLDCALLRTTFNWEPKWHIDDTIDETCMFYKAWLDGKDLVEEINDEINRFYG